MLTLYRFLKNPHKFLRINSYYTCKPPNSKPNMLTRLETENDQSKYCLAHKISVLNASVNSSKKLCHEALQQFNCPHHGTQYLPVCSQKTPYSQGVLPGGGGAHSAGND